MSPSNADETDKGPSNRKNTSRSTRSGASGKKSAAKKGAGRSKRAAGAKSGSGGGQKPPPGADRKGREAAVSRETLVRRVADARRTSLVVLAFRAAGGALITVVVTMVFFWVISIPVRFIATAWAVTPLGIGTAALLVIAARFATVRSLPEPASALPFLNDIVFTWMDPFREDRPHLLPMWLEAILWAPSQVLVGALPYLRIHATGPAETEAAADVARRMFEEGEIDLSGGLPGGSAEAKGLRLLLLLRLARLVVEDGKLKGRVSGLGQAALFEGTVG